MLATETPGHWPARAYFQALTKGRYMYVIGGQNFVVIPDPSPVGPPFLSSFRLLQRRVALAATGRTGPR